MVLYNASRNHYADYIEDCCRENFIEQERQRGYGFLDRGGQQMNNLLKRHLTFSSENVSNPVRFSRPVPIELSCELFTFLPLEHSVALVTMSAGLARICGGKVRDQFQKWKAFYELEIAILLRKHQLIFPMNIGQLWVEFKERMIKKDIEIQSQELVNCIPEKTLELMKDFHSRQKVLCYLVSCLINMYNLKRSLKSLLNSFADLYKSKIYVFDQWNANFAEHTKKLRAALAPLPFSRVIQSSNSEVCRKRFEKRYHMVLREWREEVDSIEANRGQGFQCTPCYERLKRMENELQKHGEDIRKYHKIYTNLWNFIKKMEQKDFNHKKLPGLLKLAQQQGNDEEE